MSKPDHHPLKVIDPCAKYGMLMSSRKTGIGWTVTRVKNYVKFDLEVKGHRRIEIISVHETLSHGDIPCAKYGKPTSDKKKLYSGYESAQTDGQTE